MVYWATLPARKKSQEAAVARDRYLEDALRFNFMPRFYRELRNIAVSPTNIIVSAAGLPGSGKSIVIEDIVRVFLGFRQPPDEPDIDYCFWTLQDLLKKVKTYSQGDYFILDEQIHIQGYGSRTLKEKLHNLERTVRQEMLSFFFICPVLETHLHNYIIEPWEMGSDEPWDWTVDHTKQWQYTRSLVRDHEKRPLGSIVTLGPQSDEYRKKYLKRKTTFIGEDVTQQKTGNPALREILDYVKMLIADDERTREFLMVYVTIKTKRDKLMSLAEFLEFPGLSIDAMKTLVDRLDREVSTNPALADVREFAMT